MPVNASSPEIRPPAEGEVCVVSRERLLHFAEPDDVIVAASLDQVIPALNRSEQATREGRYVAGFVAYEAAPAFDPAMATHPPSATPLVWLGVYRKVLQTPLLDVPVVPNATAGPWKPAIRASEYRRALERIRNWIASGDTYQVNFTFPMSAPFQGNAWGWFLELCEAQGCDHGVFVHTGDRCVLSASPELFFRLEGELLITRPMKGTRPRGLWLAQDLQIRDELQKSAKDRAENVMIVDLLRNDMGRISEPGSVQVQRLFELERYPTVWQMTSTIQSRTQARWAQVMQNMFPCGSVTGAPKIRTMEIIRELERFPRGVYCGCAGWAGPENTAEFNVAIRTVTVDSSNHMARCHVGGGITWDSVAAAEYEECRTKAAFLTRRPARFELLETLLFADGHFLLEAHLDRLEASATYFGYPCNREQVRQALYTVANETCGKRKVRLLLDRHGKVDVESSELGAPRPFRVGLAPLPMDSSNIFLYHKTTHRAMYNEAKADCPDCDDVILWNEREELTESVIANIVLVVDGRCWTPPVEAGLLAGVFRGWLLDQGIIAEKPLTKADLARAEAIWLINSVRKWIPVQWMS